MLFKANNIPLGIRTQIFTKLKAFRAFVAANKARHQTVKNPFLRRHLISALTYNGNLKKLISRIKKDLYAFTFTFM